jgi:hypothetical protein
MSEAACLSHGLPASSSIAVTVVPVASTLSQTLLSRLEAISICGYILIDDYCFRQFNRFYRKATRPKP